MWYLNFVIILFYHETLSQVERRSLNKCCSENQEVKAYNEIDGEEYYIRKLCQNISEASFDNIPVVDENLVGINVSLEEQFDLMPGYFYMKFSFWNDSIDLQKYFSEFNFYLTEKGVLLMEEPNVYKRWSTFESDSFCIDYTVWESSNDSQVRYWVLESTDEETTSSDVFFSIAMLVSSVFLLLVLVVYVVLRELRNLAGKILMAYVTSLLMSFLLLAFLRINQPLTETTCINLTGAIYFFLLSTFCWMNIMSYDIWWTFRGYAKARRIHRRGETFKFLMYSIYAIGVPLGMTIFFRVVDDLDLSHIPWFIQPNVPKIECFLKDGQRLVYLYIPMLILILCNWVLYLMTAYNLWRLNRGTGVLNSGADGKAHRTQKNRFLLYLKLSVVMGLNWVLEVISFLVPSWRHLWWITDTYNLLIGVIIFIIFVCKPTIMRKLKKIVNTKNMASLVSSNNTNSNVGSPNNSIQETQERTVCSDPKGPKIIVKHF